MKSELNGKKSIKELRKVLRDLFGARNYQIKKEGYVVGKLNIANAKPSPWILISHIESPEFSADLDRVGDPQMWVA